MGTEAHPYGRAASGTHASLLECALELFADYDEARLGAYAKRGDPKRVAMQHFGRCRALSFAEVGYFNRVYGVDTGAPHQLSRLLAFYADSAHPTELVPAAGFDLRDIAAPLHTAGFTPGPRYARLELDLRHATPDDERRPDGIEVISPVTTRDREAVLDTYLRGFGAEEANLEQAKANMRLLFDLPELHFLLGLVDGYPGGIGMLYIKDDLAYLCGGATLPTHLKRGCHAALIRERIDLARELGAAHVVSWAHAWSESQRNMEARGLTTMAVDRAWVRPASAGGK